MKFTISSHLISFDLRCVPVNLGVITMRIPMIVPNVTFVGKFGSS